MILFSSCSNYREGETSETSEIGKTALNRIDPEIVGKETFEAMFFLKGNMVNNISGLYQIKKELLSSEFGIQQLEFIDDFGTDVISILEETNPDYFNRFGEILISGNNFRIEEEINSASELIFKSAKKSEKYASILQSTEKVFIDEEIQKFIAENDMNDSDNINKLNQLVEEKIELDDTTNPLVLGCTPWAAWCVYKVAAIGVSVAVVLYTAIGYASVLVKTGAYWSSQSKPEIEIIKNRELISEISRYVRVEFVANEIYNN